MFRNYLTTAFRNIFKKKGYSLLNIFGLTIGMSCCLLIFHYVSYEKSYDDFVPDSKNVVRLRLDSYQKGKLAWQSATVYPAIAPHLKKDYPEVEDFCRIIDANLLLSTENNTVKFNENKGYYAEPSFLSMFGLKLTEGNSKQVLDGPDKMIVSESMAKKYFGNEEAVGKKLIQRM